MVRYKDYNQNQGQFIVVDFQSQIRKGTFEYALNQVIEEDLDLSVFDIKYKNTTTGAPAYNPKVMLKIILYAYSQGITSSRKIEELCHTNVIYMALSANTRPHFTSIADFISSSSKEVSKFFSDIVMVCNGMGLIGKEMFAIDGCKLSSNASKEWSGTFEDYRRKRKKLENQMEKVVLRHKKLDEEKEESKKQVAKEKKSVDSFKQKIKKFTRFVNENEKRIGKRNKEIQSNITDPESGKMKSSNGVIQGYNGIAAVDAKNQIILETDIVGNVDERSSVSKVVEGIEENLNENFKNGKLSNTILVADTGFNSEDVLEDLSNREIDAYIPDSHFRDRDPKFEGRERYDRPVDRKKTIRNQKYFNKSDYIYDESKNCFICPAGEILNKKGTQIKVNSYEYQIYQSKIKSCKNCILRTKCIQGKSKNPVKQLSVQLKNLKSKKYSELMKEKIDTLKGRYIYSRRMGIVEPVFAHICHTMKLRYFSLRGKEKVHAQWKLFAIVHNLKKIFKFAPAIA